MSIELDYLTLSRMDVAIGATTPVPSGGPGSIIWSNTVGDVLKWNGSAWVSNVGVGTLASQDASSVQVTDLQVDGTLSSTGNISSPAALSLTGNTSASGAFFGPNGAVHKIYSDGTSTLRYRYNAGTIYIMVHTGNIATYAPTKTGTGASGTWPISITGNAATATTSTSAGNVTGVVAVANGGTGVSSLTDIKIALSINNVSNTSDSDKPVSSAQQAALDLKLGLGGGDLLGTVNFQDNSLYRARIVDSGCGFWDFGICTTGTWNISPLNGNHVRAQAGAAMTITISDWSPNNTSSIILIELVNGAAFPVTWPTINWVKSDGTFTTSFASNGVTLQASGIDFILIWSRDGGTTIYGKVMR